jgi:hypothetical protein
MSRNAGLFMLLACFTATSGCGGGGSSGKGGGVGGGGGGGGSVSAPIIVTVAAGSASSGVNITVPAPASTTPPNAEVLGVAASLSGASAFNTGGTISRATTRTVLLFGHGLSGNMQVAITGPGDISINGTQGITATDGTPGIAFTAAVDSTAALGARTVILQNTSNNDITTFTGGLEVVP